MAFAVSSSTETFAPEAASPFDAGQIAGGLDAVREIEIRDSAHLAELMKQVESIKCRAHALSIDLLEASEQAGLHFQDGHRSAKNMTRHVNKLSGGEASGREQCRRMFRKLPVVAAAYRTGGLGTDQVMLLGRVFANPRVRGAMEGRQEWFLEHAAKLSFPRFEQRVRSWERLIDEDGPEPASERAQNSRAANMNQDPFDLVWDLTAKFTSVDGAFVNEIHQAYCQALFELDWAEAKARVGDSVCMADLCRTPTQRRSDALVQMAADAAANENGMAPIDIDHTVVWTAPTYEEMARRNAGAKPQPIDIDDYRCETINGDPLDPVEAFASSLVNKIRRAVVDAKGVVIDKGRARYFTGLTRDAVRITGRECFWPGCWLPATRCETDHLYDHAKGGRTNPGNGAPGCGMHNRWRVVRLASLRLCVGSKSAVPAVLWRDDTGQIRIQRPDGTEITSP
nr:hypothetical protein [uncultured bacterium]